MQLSRDSYISASSHYKEAQQFQFCWMQFSYSVTLYLNENNKYRDAIPQSERGMVWRMKSKRKSEDTNINYWSLNMIVGIFHKRLAIASWLQNLCELVGERFPYVAYPKTMLAVTFRASRMRIVSSYSFLQQNTQKHKKNDLRINIIITTTTAVQNIKARNSTFFLLRF